MVCSLEARASVVLRRTGDLSSIQQPLGFSGWLAQEHLSVTKTNSELAVSP
jgi:hypothetical protein